jgi:hypothetical protein
MRGVIPAAPHRAISTLARKTNHLERFNNTLRQRVSRLAHDAWSFSKTLAHHMGAIQLFICHDNLTRAAASSEHYMDITTIIHGGTTHSLASNPSVTVPPLGDISTSAESPTMFADGGRR